MNYLTKQQVARLAGCSEKPVDRAIAAGEIKGEKSEHGALTQHGKDRKSPRQMIWKLDPVSARAWAEQYRAKHAP